MLLQCVTDEERWLLLQHRKQRREAASLATNKKEEKHMLLHYVKEEEIDALVTLGVGEGVAGGCSLPLFEQKLYSRAIFLKEQ